MLYLLLVSLIWAFSWGLVKHYLSGLDANCISFLRIALALPIFLPFLRLKGLSVFRVLTLLGIGAIQYGLMYLCVIRAYQYLQAYQVALFTTFTPIYVTLLNDAFSGKFRPFSLFTAVLALIGAASIYYKSNADLLLIGKGFLLVQGSDLCFAFGQVAYKRFREQNPQLEDKSIYAWLFIGALLVTGMSTHYFGAWGTLSALSLTQIGVLVYLGMVATGLCFFWWNKGATKVAVSTLAVFNNLKIPLGVLASLLIFQEKADYFRVGLALGIIMLALVLAQFGDKKTD